MGKLAKLGDLLHDAQAMSTEPDPEWVIQELFRVVDSLPVSELREICSGLPGSYHKPEAMRFRIKESLRRNAGLRELIKNAFIDNAVCVPLLRTLDPLEIPSILPPLLALEEKGCLKLALWLDPRIRDLAERFDSPVPPNRDPRNRSLEETQQAIVGYLRWIHHKFLENWEWPDEALSGAFQNVPEWQNYLHLSSGVSQTPHPAYPSALEIPPASGVDGRQPVESSESAAAADEIDLWKKRLKDARDRGAAEKRELEATLATERETARTQHLKDQSFIEELRTRLQDLESRWRATVDQEVERAVSRRIRPWLAIANEEEAWIAEHCGDWESLKDEVRRAIELQTEEDRRSGNRSRLRKELDEARAYRNRLADIAQDSLRPLTRIKPLLIRIDALIEDLEGRLGGGGSSDTVSESLLTAIAVAESDPTLSQLLETVRALASMGVITKAASERILPAIEERRSLLRDVDVMGTSVVIPTMGTANPSPTGRVQPSDVLKGKVPGRILVDVYNMIGRQAAVLKVPEGPESMPVAWRKLKDAFEVFARNRPKVEFLLVVDGPHGKIEQWGPNLRVEYSGGAGKDRADDVLLGRVDWLCRESGNAGELATTFLVSDDQTLRKGALMRGVQWVSTDQFAKRLTLG